MLISACGDTPSQSITEPDPEADSEQEATMTTPETAGTPRSAHIELNDDRADQAGADSAGQDQTDVELYLRFAHLDRDSKWQDLFDALTTSEQSCIREELDEQSLEPALATPVFGLFDDAEPKTWELSMLPCLLPETVHFVFLSEFVGVFVVSLQDALQVDLSTEEVFCIRDQLVDFDIAAVVTALVNEDIEVITDLTWDMLACLPDYFYSQMVERAGMESRELTDEESKCIGEWIADLDGQEKAAFMFPEDHPEPTTSLAYSLLACVPDYLLALAPESLQLELGELSEAQMTCIQNWLTGLGDQEAAVIDAPSEENLVAAVHIYLGFAACVPNLFLSSFAEGMGVEAEDISEDQQSCLREWLLGLDEDEIEVLISPEDDLEAATDIGLSMLSCVPDLVFPGSTDGGVRDPV